MRAVYEAAAAYLGLKEWPGAKHNPQIVEFASMVGADWVQDDETPWCASFVGAVLAECGLVGTGKLNARSYLDWGEPMDLKEAQKGDVVVFWREKPTSWKGHVGFYHGEVAGSIEVLGGNQGNAVSVAKYPAGRLLGVRRGSGAPAAAQETPAPETSPAQRVGVPAAWAALGGALAAFAGALWNWIGG
ncbi:MAG: TIGR02594 family protein [Planctomycetota bacterium]